VNRVRPKQRRLRLDPDHYEQLREKVLCRDSWRCQGCGAISNLEVHHQQFRSQAGDDSVANLITLCATCHDALHRA
jgi:5-methylcytosine-specific restriction endonuclease McrA